MKSSKQLKLPGSSKWKSYNRSLIKRGEITFWVTEGVLKSWRNKVRTGKRGAPFIYPDAVIQCCWLVRLFYHLPLRATEGFFRSLMKSWKLNLSVPSYSTLSRRPKGPRWSPAAAAVKVGKEPIHVVVDSSGLKVFGEGEWKVRQHGADKRRTWRKLHVALNALSGDILCGELTRCETVDAQVLPKMLKPIQGQLFSVIGDGAYDVESSYRSIERKKALPIIVPRCTAVIRHRKRFGLWEHPRDFNLRMIRRWGRKTWKKASGYHLRSLAESYFSRHKRILGPSLRSRCMRNQIAEAGLSVLVMNKINHNPKFQNA